MSKAEWAAIHREYKGTREVRGARVRTAMRSGALAGVYLTDAKRVDPPEDGADEPPRFRDRPLPARPPGPSCPLGPRSAAALSRSAATRASADEPPSGAAAGDGVRSDEGAASRRGAGRDHAAALSDPYLPRAAARTSAPRTPAAPPATRSGGARSTGRTSRGRRTRVKPRAGTRKRPGRSSPNSERPRTGPSTVARPPDSTLISHFHSLVPRLVS